MQEPGHIHQDCSLKEIRRTRKKKDSRRESLGLYRVEMMILAMIVRQRRREQTYASWLKVIWKKRLMILTLTPL